MFWFGLKTEIESLKQKAEKDLQDLESHLANVVTALEARVKTLEASANAAAKTEAEKLAAKV